MKVVWLASIPFPCNMPFAREHGGPFFRRKFTTSLWRIDHSSRVRVLAVQLPQEERTYQVFVAAEGGVARVLHRHESRAAGRALSIAREGGGK